MIVCASDGVSVRLMECVCATNGVHVCDDLCIW